MPFRKKGLGRLKNRREAERVLREIIEDGGNAADFRIEEAAVGGCMIVVLADNSQEVVGRIGA